MPAASDSVTRTEPNYPSLCTTLPVPGTNLDLTAYRRLATDDLVIVINDAELGCVMRIILEQACAGDALYSAGDCCIRFEAPGE